MKFNYINITSSGTAVQILSPAVTNSKKINTMERLLICNNRAADIGVNLYLDNGSAQYSILTDCVIPEGTTLDVLHGVPFQYEESYGLKLTLTDAAHRATIIFNQQ